MPSVRRRASIIAGLAKGLSSRKALKSSGEGGEAILARTCAATSASLSSSTPHCVWILSFAIVEAGLMDGMTVSKIAVMTAHCVASKYPPFGAGGSCGGVGPVAVAIFTEFGWVNVFTTVYQNIKKYQKRHPNVSGKQRAVLWLTN